MAWGEASVAFIQRLSQLTSADIRASHNLTGNSTLGGNGLMEVTRGKNSLMTGGLGQFDKSSQSNDIVTGSSRSDRFAVARILRRDALLNFVMGQEWVARTNNLTFPQLSITRSDRANLMGIASPGELFAFLEGSSASILTWEVFS